MHTYRKRRWRPPLAAMLGVLLGLALLVLGSAQQAVARPLPDEAGGGMLRLLATGDARTNESQPNQTYGSAPLKINSISRSYVAFDLLPLPADATISRAMLVLQVTDAAGPNLPQTVEVARVNAAWDETTLTHANQPPVTPTGIGTAVGNPGNATWDVTPLVQAWHEGTLPNHGLALDAPGQSDFDLTLSSKESGLGPYLLVEYSVPDHPAPHPDLGDAPDSSNHHGIPNTAYPGTPGRFPTVYDPALGAPIGPKHVNPHGEAILGNFLTREAEADQGPDQDGSNNILNNGQDNANRDRADDGWLNRNVPFPRCHRTLLRVRVTRLPTSQLDQMYLNVWFDGNRDGDWEDAIRCPGEGDSPDERAAEWIVRNHVVNLGAIAPGGFVDLAVPTRLIPNGTPDAPHWMRFTLSEERAVHPPERWPDGRGPQGGFAFGETEDVLQRPQPPGEPGTLVLTKSVEADPQPVPYGGIVTYQIRLKHVGGTAPAETEIRDRLEWPLHLIGDVTVEEVLPEVAPLEARVRYVRDGRRQVDQVIVWRGTLSPGAEVLVSFPVHVHPLCGPDESTRDILNVAHARQTDGTVLSDETVFTAACPGYNLDNVTVSRTIVDDDAAQVADVAPDGGDGGSVLEEVHLRTTITNENAEAISLSVRDALTPVEPAASAAPSGDGDRPRTFRLELGPGESHTYDTVQLIDGGTIGAAERQVRHVVTYCLLPEHTTDCPDPDEYPGAVATNERTFSVRHRDLGDAPDSSNHFGANMTAYPPAVPADFPTVFDPATGLPQGPAHAHPRPFHLGRRVSAEVEADIGPDQDPTNNIIPPQDIPNRDRADDGTRPLLWNLPRCGTTTVPVRVFISPAAIAYLQAQTGGKGYLNGWLDLNRNGNWRDVVTCQPPTGGPPRLAIEHIIRDYEIDVVALGPGLHTLNVPTGVIAWPTDPERTGWLRLTLSEAKVPKPFTAADGTQYGDGRGPSQAYRLGESEDYLLDPQDIDAGIDLRGVRRQVDNVPPSAAPDSSNEWEHVYVLQGVCPTCGRPIPDPPDPDDPPRRPLPPLTSTLRIDFPSTLSYDSISVRSGNCDCLDYEIEGNLVTAVVDWRALGGWDDLEFGVVARVDHSAGNPLAEGELVVRATIETEGDVNPDNDVAEAPFDLRPPAPRIVRPQNGTTNQTTIPVAGRAVPGASVTLYVNGSAVATVPADPQGAWSHTFAAGTGTHELYAVAQVGGNTSPPSDRRVVVVDDDLLLNPLALRVVPEAASAALAGENPDWVPPVDEAGRTDRAGWQVSLVPGTPHTVSVWVQCADANGYVELLLGDADPLALDEVERDGDAARYAATFTPTADQAGDPLALNVGCGGAEQLYEGTVEVASEDAGTVRDAVSGDALANASVACLVEQAASYALWPASEYGQSNPQATESDGGYGFWTPPGTYRLEVARDGYQPYRSLDQAIVTGPLGVDVPLTPAIADEADATVEMTDLGATPAVLRVEPGEVVEWVNLDTEMHSATRDGGWDSGLLAPGESYKRRFDSEGTYQYVDAADPSNAATIIVEEETTSGPLLLFVPVVVK